MPPTVRDGLTGPRRGAWLKPRSWPVAVDRGRFATVRAAGNLKRLHQNWLRQAAFAVRITAVNRFNTASPSMVLGSTKSPAT